MSNLKDTLKSVRLEYRNSKGKKLKHRYIVIESDDWGSIRQPSQEVWRIQVQKSERTLKDPFFHFDAFERNQDMERLFEVLHKYKDCEGNHPIITADYAVANPDFQKIRDGGFQLYQYEQFTETATHYQDSDHLLELCQQGIHEGLWKPQLHCREHVQIRRWMSALQAKDPEIMWAFDHQMISTADAVEDRNHYAYMDAFNYQLKDSECLDTIISEAANIFQSLFGFASRTFVASCYVWNQALEHALNQNGINSMQGSWYQWVPSENEEGAFNRIIHHNGDSSKQELYLVRNCLFEHSLFNDEKCVESCLKQIEVAFRWNQPAVISTHRVNYMGRIVPENGENGIYLLDILLREILIHWPDVLFITSDQLADIYS